MRKLLILTILGIFTVAASGCASCGRPFMSWFNRGDSCRTCADGHCDDGHVVHDDGSPGLLGSPIYGGDIGAPSLRESLPGPAISPLPNPR